MVGREALAPHPPLTRPRNRKSAGYLTRARLNVLDMRRLLAAGAAAGLLLLSGTTALAAPDLGGTLKPAPDGQGWVEASRGNPNLLEGPLTSDDLARLDPGNESSVKLALATHGFVAAYARTWVQQGSNRVLLEMVKAFHSSGGANQWYSAAKQGARSVSGATPIDTNAVPDSYGLVGQTTTGAYNSSVVFVKGNDVFHIAIGDPAAPANSSVLSQAQSAYLYAPEYSIKPAAKVSPLSLVSQLRTSKGLAGLAVLVALPLAGLLAGALALWVRERRLAATPEEPALTPPASPSP